MNRRSFLQASALATCLRPRLSAPGALEAIVDPSLDPDRLLKQAQALRGGREVRLRLLLPEGSIANLRPALEAFEGGTGTRFELREVAVDEVATTMLLEGAAGKFLFDLALPPTFGLPELASSRLLLPLDGLRAKYEPETLMDQSIYQLGSEYNGAFYGYQTDGDVYLMFYLREWLEDQEHSKRYQDAQGEDLALPRTWEQLDAQMRFFHDPDKGRYGGTLFRIPGYVEWEWWMRMHAKGSFPLDRDMQPLFTSEAGVSALEDLIRASQWQTPGSSTQGLFDNWSDYARGHAYANVGWGGTQKFLHGPESPVRGKLLHGPTPGGRFGEGHVPCNYFNWGWNYVIARTSSESELAFLLSLYATLPEVSTRCVREASGFFDPHQEQHYSDPDIAEVYSPEFLNQHRRSLLECMPDFYLRGRDEYFALLGSSIARANRGDLTPQAALALAARGWNQITDRMGRDAQIARWRQLRAQYPTALLKALQG